MSNNKHTQQVDFTNPNIDKITSNTTSMVDKLKQHLDSITQEEFEAELEKDACIEFGDWLLTKEISYVDNTDEGNVYMVESNIDRRIMTMKEIYEFYLKDQG